MKRFLAKASRLAFLMLTMAALHGCGHGGTEVGNPPGPQVPSAGAPDDVENAPSPPSPTPSPGANLIFEEPGDENEIALNPEETES